MQEFSLWIIFNGCLYQLLINRRPNIYDRTWNLLTSFEEQNKNKIKVDEPVQPHDRVICLFFPPLFLSTYHSSRLSWVWDIPNLTPCLSIVICYKISNLSTSLTTHKYSLSALCLIVEFQIMLFFLFKQNSIASKFKPRLYISMTMFVLHFHLCIKLTILCKLWPDVTISP